MQRTSEAWTPRTTFSVYSQQPGHLHEEDRCCSLAVHHRQHRLLVPPTVRLITVSGVYKIADGVDLCTKSRVEERTVRSIAELEQLSLDLRDHAEEGHHDHWESYRRHEAGHGEAHH